MKEFTGIEIDELVEQSAGICLACGELAFGVEPDAENYTCEECDETQVQGIENALVAGNITVIEGVT